MEDAPLGRLSASADDRYDLIFERQVAQPQHAIWTAIATAEGLACWLSEAEIELRPGGRFRMRGQCTVDGEVLEVRAPELFRWTWPHADHPASVVEIALAGGIADSTRVTLTQSDLPRHLLMDVATGWHTHLDALPRAALGQRTAFDPRLAAMHHARYAVAIGHPGAAGRP